jgi:hypothetical protein
VDGKAVASNLVATALHNKGQWADVVVESDLAATPHQIAVTFTDDLWTKAGDRNLYIDYIEVNGRRFEGESATSNTAKPTTVVDGKAAPMLTNGTVTFTVDSYAPHVISGTNASNTLSGTAEEDRIAGLGGADKIKAGAGNDIVSGGRGKDALWGGAGDDTFLFGTVLDSQPGTNRDVIYDWGDGQGDRGDDLIDLHLLDANILRSGNQAFHFIGHRAFSGQAGELRTVYDGHDTIVQANLDGDKAAELQIKVAGRHALSAADFVL